MLKRCMYVCCNFTSCLAKTRERVGKGKGGREGRGNGREREKKIHEVVWFVREKWREI